MKYERLCNRLSELANLFDKPHNDKYTNEHYSLCSIFECKTLELYAKIKDFAKNHNFNKVYDIGCAYGHQNEVFIGSNVEYVGINDHELEFWNKDKYEYKVGEYPLEIEAEDNDLAVSVLCLTWNCYLYEGEETLKKQCEALKKDFKQCLLYIAEDKVNFVKKYFKSMEKIDNQLYCFYN